MSKGLKNPAAIAAVPIVGSEISKAGKAAGKRADKINKDTKGGLSILLLLGIAAGVYTVWKLTAPLRAGAGATAAGIDAIGDAIGSTPAPGTIGDTNVNDKPKEATISQIQAHSIAAGLLNEMSTFGKASTKEKNNIYNLLKGKNAIDFQMISNAFGTPRRSPVTGEHAPPLMGFQMNLLEWLSIEIGAEGINHLRTITTGIF